MKFSIRDLMLLTVIVALAVGWWVDHRRQATISELGQRKYAALERLIRQGFDVEYEGDMPVRIKMWMHIRDVPNSSAPALNPATP